MNKIESQTFNKNCWPRNQQKKSRHKKQKSNKCATQSLPPKMLKVFSVLQV